MLTSTTVCRCRILGADDHIVLAATLRILLTWIECTSSRVPLMGLVTTPSSLVEFCLGWVRCARRPGVVVIDTLLLASGFANWATSAHLDVRLRELPRTGLPAPAQQELLRRLAWTIDRRTRYFPDPPLAYVERMKELLLLAFSPQKGPLSIASAPNEASGILPRSRVWGSAYLELSTLDADRRPLRDLQTMLAGIICMMARHDFPLAIPPRWLVELLEMVNRVASLKMQANLWPLEASPEMGRGCQDYFSALALNIANDQRRSRRQWFKFRAQEDETSLGETGWPLRCPDVDQALPPAPAGLAAHRPCLWLPTPCVVSTPKRERDPSPDFSDAMSDIPEPKRRLSEIQYGGQYGTAPASLLGRRYSLEVINKDPPSGLPPIVGIIWHGN